MDRKHSTVDRILEEAAYICRRCKEAAGDVEPAEGYKRRQAEEFHNDKYEIFDAVPNNVLYGIDDKLYFIDTQIRLRADN